VIGFDVPEDFESDQIAQTGIMPLTSWAGKAIGGHCVVVVSTPKLINGTPSVRVRNSWGTGWGDNGHFWMPTAFLQCRGVHGLLDGCDDVRPRSATAAGGDRGR
jgi:C1A family cysteine protease